MWESFFDWGKEILFGGHVLESREGGGGEEQAKKRILSGNCLQKEEER